MAKFVNLNKHVISVFLGHAKTCLDFPPDGRVATVSVKQEEVGGIDFPNGLVMLVQNVYGDIQGLPEPEEGTYYIVNAIVLERAKLAGRRDCIAPDTGPTAIRDEKGQVKAVCRFVC